MRVVVTGATGNVGTSVLERLAGEESVTEIVGLARRLPEPKLPKTRFMALDVRSGDLVSVFRGASTVVHLAWMLQSQHNPKRLESVNVDGSRRVFEAVVQSEVPHLVVASSVGAYAAGPKDRRVRESWPSTGVPRSLYSRQKAAVERALDDLERLNPKLSVARIRPALIFKRAASAEIRRLFLGRLLASLVARSNSLRLVPDLPGLRIQAVHSDDVGDAFCRVIVQRARGAFNIAADPVLDAQRLASAIGGKVVRVPTPLLRTAMSLSYYLRLQPTEPGWLDLAIEGPLMSIERAMQELGWSPRHSSVDAVKELFSGIEENAGGQTAPLAAEGGR